MSLLRVPTAVGLAFMLAIGAVLVGFPVLTAVAIGGEEVSVFENQKLQGLRLHSRYPAQVDHKRGHIFRTNHL